MASRARSIGAVIAGLLAVILPTLALDQTFHALGVYPPWGEAMREVGDNLLALSYRLLIGVAGGYVAAALAPSAPVGHALVLGAIGTLLSALGAVAAISADLGPAWYPLALVVTALPCAWLGGRLRARSRLPSR